MYFFPSDLVMEAYKIQFLITENMVFNNSLETKSAKPDKHLSGSCSVRGLMAVIGIHTQREDLF